MRFFTAVGSPLVLDAVFAVACIALLARRRLDDLRFLLLASPGSVALEQVLKHSVDRHRPTIGFLTRASGASWPSGHTSSSAALFGALLLIVLARPSEGAPAARRLRRVATVLVVLVLALIGLSRVVLGVHYPTDVLASWGLAGSWLTVLEIRLGRAAALTFGAVSSA